MTKIYSIKEAFITKLQTLYDIEKQLEKTLPKMEKGSYDPELKKGFEMHLKETEMHSERLEAIFDELGIKPKKLKSEGIRGIIADGEWVEGVDAPPAIKDTMIASAARYAEHYEMAGYLTAIRQAEILGLKKVKDLLNQTLEEERLADEKLEIAIVENLLKAE